MNFVIDYGGGLGDVVQQIYTRRSYQVLNYLSEAQTAEINLITHNPSVTEIFENHPNKNFIKINNFGYWSPEQDAFMRQKYQLKKENFNPTDGDIIFYPSEPDLNIINNIQSINNKYIVIQAEAGTSDRNIPKDILFNILEKLNINYYLIGKSYDRPGKSYDYSGISEENLLVDKLTVPGTFELINRSVGVISAHTSSILYAWYNNKNNVLLYPESVYYKHIIHNDQWSFGVSKHNTQHMLFQNSHNIDFNRLYV